MPADRRSRVPPRWFTRTFWTLHRGLCRVSGGRLGLWRPKPGKWGALRLTTTGRRTGREHRVILGYVEDGPNLVALDGYAARRPSETAVVILEPTAAR